MNNNLKEIREKRGLSLRDVSKLSGLSFAYIWQLEKGKVLNPRFNTKKAIAKTLKVSVNELFF